MDAILGRMDGRFKAFTKDSTMMRIVNYAMDKAHEKVKSKEGVIERLNEISKFYQLAVMQLEACMKFVQDESDSYIPESNHEDVLVGLREIRDRLQGRLQESELAISEKDRELTERLGNELKLRQALERRERELISLRAILELERTKSEGVEVVLSNHGSREEDIDGEFCELKNSVDQQVLNIKLKLEPEHKLVDDERFRNIDNTKIEQMGSDIDILKQTMDLAFNKMQDAIFSSELEPLELQWRWTIEQDIITILIKCFMKDLQENFEAEMRKQEMKISTRLSEQFPDLMKDVTELRNELENLSNQSETQSKNTKGGESLASAPEVDSRTGGKSLPEGEEEVGGHYVAKMIKNHETIIQRKSAEQNWLQREILRARGSTMKRESEPDTLKRRIQEVIAKLDNFTNWNSKFRLGDVFCDYESVQEEKNYSAGKEDATDAGRSGVNSLEAVWEKVNKNPVSDAANKQLRDEIRSLKQGNEDANLQTIIMEDIYFAAFRGFMNEFYNELYTRDLESLIYQGFVKDTVDEWNEKIESNNIEVKTREEIYYSVFRETKNDFSSTHDFTIAEHQDCGSDYLQDSISTTALLDDLEGALSDNLRIVLFQEMYKEWNEGLASYNTDNNVREEIFRIVRNEAMIDVQNSADHTAIIEAQDVKVPENLMYNKSFESEEYSLQVDLYFVFFGEMLKEWTFEIGAYQFGSLIREEIHQFVIVEAMKEAYTRFSEAEAQNQYKVCAGLPPTARKLHRRRESSGVEYMIQTIETLIKCFEAGEDLMLKASSEIQEHNVHLDLVGSELAELDENNIFQELLTGEKNTSISVNRKLEKALQHLVMSREVLSELGSSLGITADDQMSTASSIADDKESCICLAKNNEEVKLIPSESDPLASPILDFSRLVVNLQWTAHQKLQMNIMRLEEFKTHLDLLIELVASLRQKDSLYKKAFIRRSQNLQNAEIEVDLLGDQVDALLGLLEEIYITLNHHSPVLQQYFEVSEILRLIKKELNGEVHASKQ